MTGLQDALDRYDREHRFIPPHVGTILEAARKHADLTQSGPIPASQCVFPLVKEELLVYPTDQRQAYGYTLSTETF